VQHDVLGSRFDTLTAEQRHAVLAAHPRTGLKTGMIEALSAGVRDKPETADGTMLANMLEATAPGYVRRSATRSRTAVTKRDAAAPAW
jgi:hypothetical protein